MRIVLIILSTLVSVQLSNAQVILNEAALQNVDIYNFKEINSSTLEFSPVPFQVGILYISPEKKRSKYDRRIDEGYFKIDMPRAIVNIWIFHPSTLKIST